VKNCATIGRSFQFPAIVGGAIFGGSDGKKRFHIYKIINMYLLIKNTFDLLFGRGPIRAVIHALVGNRFNGWFLWLVGYRAIHMLRSGESCIIAGIYSESTIQAFSQAAGPDGLVVVVEANPANVERLEKACGFMENVKITNKAIWREKGEMDFLMSAQEKDQGYNRLASAELQEFPEHMDDKPQIVKVPTDTLGNIACEFKISNLAHINLTINGAELQAMEGMADIRHKHPGVRIYINSETPDPAEKTIVKLNEIGFKVHVSHWIRNKNKKIQLVRIYGIG
jgi:FkbM family methyltransferase